MTGTVRKTAWRAGTLVVMLVIAGAAVSQQLTALTAAAVGSQAPSRQGSCLPGRAVPVMKSPHLSMTALEKVKYTSNPPTSGPHFAIPPAPGVYGSPLAPSEFVHALEHGHVVITYALDTPPGDVDQLRHLAKLYPSDVLLTPYDGIDHGVAVAAWGRLLRLDGVQRSAIADFVVALSGRYDHGWTRVDPC
jgi:hypothetical protein